MQRSVGWENDWIAQWPRGDDGRALFEHTQRDHLAVLVVVTDELETVSFEMPCKE